MHQEAREQRRTMLPGEARRVRMSQLLVRRQRQRMRTICCPDAAIRLDQSPPVKNELNRQLANLPAPRDARSSALSIPFRKRTQRWTGAVVSVGSKTHVTGEPFGV